MPITINGSGTVTGISAGGLPDGCITTADLDSGVPVAKAWVNFDGTGTVAIRASYNVSSITDNGTGLYRVNFTNALTDTNYAVVFGNGEAASLPSNRLISGGNFNTSYVEVATYSTGNAAQDVSFVGVSVFR